MSVKLVGALGATLVVSSVLSLLIERYVPDLNTKARFDHVRVD